jgi:hypothetical protein
MKSLGRFEPERVKEISEIIERLIPERRGQFPLIIYRQLCSRLPDYDINWIDMQLAFDYLIEQEKVYPRQNFNKSIIKRAYKYPN